MNSDIINLDRGTLKKILRSKDKLESKLKVQISNKNNNLIVTGEELDLFLAIKILEAIKKKFPIETSLLLLDEDYTIEDIPIKSETNKKNLERIRGRVIGQGGRTLKVIEELSGCYLSLHENVVSIIGSFEKMRIAENAIKSLIHGSKQANVYSYLEQARSRVVPEAEIIQPKKK
jgi:ribosomal RNA assembly protein